MAKLLRQDAVFSQRIGYVMVDEGHHIYTAGMPLYGLKAHRPAWGMLNRLRIHLAPGTPFQVLSGTLPPHIKDVVISNLNLRAGYVDITFTSNRKNISYATAPIVGSSSDFRNLDFLVTAKHKAIVFVDSKTEAQNLATYLDTHPSLPALRRGIGYAREYHGDMSVAYLRATYETLRRLMHSRAYWLRRRVVRRYVHHLELHLIISWYNSLTGH